MDLATVKTAAKQDLVACAVAAAANAQSVVDDAELLALADRRARACSLAALTVEEIGKAVSLMVLSFLPEKQKDQAPIWRTLEWHELKLAGDLLIALTPAESFPRLLRLPRSAVTNQRFRVVSTIMPGQ